MRCAVRGRAVGEVDRVGGRDGDGFAVEGYRGRVVLLLHGGVALGFQRFGFRGGGGGGGHGARGVLCRFRGR